MDALTAGRWQMEVSLAFHMMFAAAGMAMPAMLLIAESRWLRRNDLTALALARTWSRALAVLFAVGAVSGTALSFELGLLWPKFMAFAGPIVGMMFALEGYAFFTEAIFLGLYLYGWGKMSPRAHWLAAWPVAISGALSGALVLGANSWMQSPAGFDVGADGLPALVDPMAALFNPSWALMAVHAVLSSYSAVGLLAAGLYALGLLRDRRPERGPYNRMAVLIALAVATPAVILQPLVGDLLGGQAHRLQPAKLAAMEAQFATERGAPLRIGGWPDPATREVHGAVELPKLLSLLTVHDPDGEITGLDAFPPADWPNVQVVHVAFQVMVGAGFAAMGAVLLYWWRVWRRRAGWHGERRLLMLLVATGPLGFLSLQAGWIVSEAGRQPWIIYGVMRTADAGTPVVGAAASLWGFCGLYLTLAFTVVLLLRGIARGEHGTVASH